MAYKQLLNFFNVVAFDELPMNIKCDASFSFVMLHAITYFNIVVYSDGMHIYACFYKDKFIF